MTKQQRISEYLVKVAKKHGCSIEQAKEFKLTQNYIAYIEKEGRDDTGTIHSTDLHSIDDKSC
jgi:hypothetical protein